MKWITPKYSKEKVKKAGKHLLNSDIKSSEFKESIPIFHNWRSAHAFPMQIMLDLLRKNSIRIDKSSIAVQRLKRVPSIYQKLNREEKMSLSRMEDIAGCRTVVSNINQVKRVRDSLTKSRTKNILHRERDYIAEPKESGYRGIHLVFKYNGSKKEFNGMAVELQIRSKIQHSWATAVEVVGTFTKQALKASTGDTTWLDFFKYSSVEFSKLEKCNICAVFEGVDTFSIMDKCIKELDLYERLKAFRVAVNVVTNAKEKGSGYFILILNLEKKVVEYYRYEKTQLGEATELYDEKEQEYKNNTNIDVVLVSAGSVRDMKRAYPNYFADTTEFEKYILQVYMANK